MRYPGPECQPRLPPARADALVIAEVVKLETENPGLDYVITVCDRTAETCPTFPGDPERIHWSFEDPEACADAEARRRAFELVANGLAARMRIWMALPAVHRRLEAAEE